MSTLRRSAGRQRWWRYCRVSHTEQWKQPRFDHLHQLQFCAQPYTFPTAGSHYSHWTWCECTAMERRRQGYKQCRIQTYKRKYLYKCSFTQRLHGAPLVLWHWFQPCHPAPIEKSVYRFTPEPSGVGSPLNGSLKTRLDDLRLLFRLAANIYLRSVHRLKRVIAIYKVGLVLVGSGHGTQAVLVSNFLSFVSGVQKRERWRSAPPAGVWSWLQHPVQTQEHGHVLCQAQQQSDGVRPHQGPHQHVSANTGDGERMESTAGFKTETEIQIFYWCHSVVCLKNLNFSTTCTTSEVMQVNCTQHYITNTDQHKAHLVTEQL